MSRILSRAVFCMAAAALASCSSGNEEDFPVCKSSPADTFRVAVVCLKRPDLFDLEAIVRAQAAYRSNAAIVLERGSIKELKTALGIAGSEDDAQGSAGTPEAPPDGVVEPVRLVPGFVGTALLTNGQTNDLEHKIQEDALLTAEDEIALQAWRPELRASRVSQASSAWSEQYTKTTSSSTTNGSLSLVSTYYRLNGSNTVYDYYMVTTALTGSSTLSACSSPFAGNGRIGYYSAARNVTIRAFDGLSLPDGTNSLTGKILVFDSGPNTSVGSSSSGFSIGGSLSASGPGISGSYSQSYPVSDVNVTKSVPTWNRQQGTLASWGYTFQGPDRTPVRCPPASSTSAYTTYQAAIVQVPKGARVNMRTGAEGTFYYQSYTNILGIPYDIRYSPLLLNVFDEGYTVKPPRFEVSTTNLEIPRDNGTARFSITAEFPTGIEGGYGPAPTAAVNWAITNIPSWLIVDRVSGSGNAVIGLTAQPGTAAGTTAQLNVNTSPAGAALSVGSGPLVVRVVAR